MCIRDSLRKGVKYKFTPAMEVIVREILVELAAPPILVFPDWDAAADGSLPFHVYCDACIEGFGAALEQEQPGGSVRPIAYISRATLDSERHWTPLDLEAGSIVWSIKRLRRFASSRITRRSKALEKWKITTRESRGGSSFSQRSTAPSGTARACLLYTSPSPRD